MSVEGIVSGQKVSEEKLRLAPELRRRITAEERILWQHLRGHRLQINPALLPCRPGTPAVPSEAPVRGAAAPAD